VGKPLTPALYCNKEKHMDRLEISGEIQTIKLPDIVQEHPSATLRWRNGVLQQLWEIKKYRGGTPLRYSTEWRDVEHAD
jgi:hypothetical protein